MSEQQSKPEIPEDMRRMIASVEASNGLLGPYDVSEDLKPVFDELELWEPLNHLREHGYAVIENVAPIEAMDDLRDAIHTIAEDTPGESRESRLHLICWGDILRSIALQRHRRYWRLPRRAWAKACVRARSPGRSSVRATRAATAFTRI